MKQFFLQDIFLNYLRREHEKASIVTVDKMNYIGYVQGFDKQIVVLDLEQGQVMLFKNNIIGITSEMRILSEKYKENYE